MNELTPIPHSEKELEKQPMPIEAWEPKENGLHTKQEGIRLGIIKTPEGAYVTKDSASTIVSEAGAEFTVTQNSAGLTRTSVRPLEGFAVSTLTLDPETQLPTWKGASEYSDEVVVSADYGKLVEDDSVAATQAWNADTVFGNEGIHAGIVRITGPENSTRYYAFGADFQGDADNWNVASQLIEVSPSHALEVPNQQIES